MSPAVSMSYWTIFERNSVELTDFAGSKFQRMANWPSFVFLIETVNCTKLFRIILPVSMFLSKLGELAIRYNSSPQNRSIPLDSSRKLTMSSLRGQETFFNVPGRKSLPKNPVLFSGIIVGINSFSTKNPRDFQYILRRFSPGVSTEVANPHFFLQTAFDFEKR